MTSESGNDQTVRVLVVDDDPLVRRYVALLVETAGAEVVGDAPDGATAVERTREHRPDVVLMDVAMPRLDGSEATAEIMRIVPETRVIAMTSLGTEDALARMVTAGALGFLMKECIVDEIGPALTAVIRGEGFASPQPTAQLLRRVAEASGDEQRRFATERFETLTDREREVAVLVAAGATNPEIARRLFVSPSTAKTHVEQIGAKLGVTVRQHIAILVDRAGHGPALGQF